MIRTAYLRVYLPADRAGRLPAHVPSGARVVRASDHFVWDEPLGEDALTVTWNGGRYTCPRYPRLRMLEGLLAFTNSYPMMPLLTETEAGDYSEELADLKSRSPQARSYILASPWHVPLRWFAAFHPAERELYRTGDDTAIRYRATLGDAVDRASWAVRVLDAAGFADGVVEQMRDLERWMSEFTADSMLELDYAGVSVLFSDAELALDESSAEVRKSLEALERGDPAEAGEHYMAVATRWAQHQAVTYSN